MPGIGLASLRGDLSLPTSWEDAGRVEQLYIYPVKSMAVVPVPEFHTGKFGAEAGLVVDRQFCVVDNNGKFISARRYPSMVLIKPSLSRTSGWLSTCTTLTLSFPGCPDLILPLPVGNEPSKDITIWGDGAQGVDCGDKAARWLSNVILANKDGGLRLIYHKEKVSSRPDKALDDHLRPLEQAEDKPLYADGYGYLLLSAASIEGLNHRLAAEGKDLVVEQTRFRPNIFVSGDFSPFHEDTWTFIKIGDAVFRNVKLCTRTTEDEDEKKVYGTTPFIGVNLGVHTEGKIKIGDTIYVGKKIN